MLLLKKDVNLLEKWGKCLPMILHRRRLIFLHEGTRKYGWITFSENHLNSDCKKYHGKRAAKTAKVKDIYVLYDVLYVQSIVIQHCSWKHKENVILFSTFWLDCAIKNRSDFYKLEGGCWIFQVTKICSEIFKSLFSLFQFAFQVLWTLNCFTFNC